MGLLNSLTQQVKDYVKNNSTSVLDSVSQAASNAAPPAASQTSAAQSGTSNAPAAAKSDTKSTYTPTSVGTPQAPTTSAADVANNIYKIGSYYGIDTVNKLASQGGGTFTATNKDGSKAYWTVDANGGVSVTDDAGKQYVGRVDASGLTADQRAALENAQANRQALIDYQRALAEQEAQWEEYRQAALAANQAATEKSVLALQEQLEQTLPQYDELRAQNAITSAQAADNLALQRAAAGDKGGIGNKQYSDQQASYDAQLYQIQLEQVNFKNSVNSQIEQLEAEGRFNEAQILSEWGQARINALQEQADKIYSLSVSAADAAYQTATDAADRAYDKAMQNLQLGIFSADDAKALGIAPEEAQRIADYYRLLADIDLAQAKQSLAKLTTGGGSGGSRGPRKKSADTTESTSVDPFQNISAADVSSISNRILNGGITVLHPDGRLGQLGANANGDLLISDAMNFVPGDMISANGVSYYYDPNYGFTNAKSVPATVQSTIYANMSR